MPRHVFTAADKAKAGRPKGSKNKLSVRAMQEMGEKAARGVMITPLEYALSILNDTQNSFARRSWACGVAMPYCHARKVEIQGGDPTKPIMLAAAQSLKALSPAEFLQLQDLSRRIAEKAVEEPEDDAS